MIFLKHGPITLKCPQNPLWESITLKTLNNLLGSLGAGNVEVPRIMFLHLVITIHIYSFLGSAVDLLLLICSWRDWAPVNLSKYGRNTQDYFVDSGFRFNWLQCLLYSLFCRRVENGLQPHPCNVTNRICCVCLYLNFCSSSSIWKSCGH